MLRRLFRYSPLLGCLVVVLLGLLVFIGSLVARLYFDWFSQYATYEHLRSESLRYVFMAFGALAAIALISSILRR